MIETDEPTLPIGWEGRMVARSPCLVASWCDGLIVDNYLRRTQSAITPSLIALLDSLSEPVAIQDLITTLGGGGEGLRLLLELEAQGLVVLAGSDADVRETGAIQAWPWGLASAAFHFAANDAVFVADPDTQTRELTKKAQTHPPPPTTRKPHSALTRLPRCTQEPTDLWHTVRQRRTSRSYGEGGLTLNEFATISSWTWGATGTIQTAMGEYLMKTSPSAGARHPIDVYALIRAVEGIESGAYYYHPLLNAIERVGPAPPKSVTADLCGGQAWIADSAVVFLMTAVVERLAWKYDHPRAYRTLFLDAGHLGQCFQTVCAALGLASAVTAAIDERAIVSILGLDEVAEFPVYAVAVGRQGLAVDPARPS